jgi:hypothetical protein
MSSGAVGIPLHWDQGTWQPLLDLGSEDRQSKRIQHKICRKW